MIPETMKTEDLYAATITSLKKFGEDPPLVIKTGSLTGRELLTKDPGSVGTFVFVVRRPGCPLVRGDARILQSKIDAGEFEGFAVKSIVKETGVDDGGLVEFATEYFPHPAYKDEALTFYHALGSGKFSTGFNPIATLRLIRGSKKRIKELGVKSHNTKGEGFLQGGWILFDTDGIPKAAFRENAKKKVQIDDILREVESMRSNKTQQTMSDEKKE